MVGIPIEGNSHPPCDDIVGKFGNNGFVEVSINEVLIHEKAGDTFYVFTN
jgi:hypothetical protein